LCGAHNFVASRDDSPPATGRLGGRSEHRCGRTGICAKAPGCPRAPARTGPGGSPLLLLRCKPRGPASAYGGMMSARNPWCVHQRCSAPQWGHFERLRTCGKSPTVSGLGLNSGGKAPARCRALDEQNTHRISPVSQAGAPPNSQPPTPEEYALGR
jgi:hypothetical protein